MNVIADDLMRLCRRMHEIAWQLRAPAVEHGIGITWIWWCLEKLRHRHLTTIAKREVERPATARLHLSQGEVDGSGVDPRRCTGLQAMQRKAMGCQILTEGNRCG